MVKSNLDKSLDIGRYASSLSEGLLWTSMFFCAVAQKNMLVRKSLLSDEEA
jgi:hypothetical protein